MDVHTILYKEQFRLKLGFDYLLASGWAIIFLIVIILLDMNLEKAGSIYIFGLIMIYKYVFNYTRDGYYYEPIVYKYLSILMKKIRERA